MQKEKRVGAFYEDKDARAKKVWKGNIKSFERWCLFVGNGLGISVILPWVVGKEASSYGLVNLES